MESNITKLPESVEREKENPNNIKIPIVLASDNNYAKYMYVTVLSMLENKNESSFYDIYLLVTPNFSEKFKVKFNKLIDKFCNTNVSFIDMGNTFLNRESKIKHITFPTYYRLKVPEILKCYNKAIYLDTDTIILKDLSEFYNTTLDNNYIAGVLASGYILNKEKSHIEYYKSIGMTSLDKYINAGVTLWNLEKIRQNNLTDTLCSLVKNNYNSSDQDIINLTFFDNIKILDLKYNLMTTYEKFLLYDRNKRQLLNNIYGETQIEKAIEDPVIIHYADKIKPWNDKRVWLAAYWWEYAKLTPFYKEIYRDLKIKHFINNIFSIKNQTHNNKKYKLITIAGLKIKIRRRTKFDKLKNRRYDPNLSLEDKKYIIELQFEQYVGYKPNIDYPQSFNEKLQWLKLYNEDPLLTKCADKYLVREYVKEKIGEEYLIPLLGVWDSPDEIDFDKLPNQFVLKVNWGCGQNIIVKDKSKLDIKKAKAKLKKWLKPHSNHYYHSFEWSYKNIKPKIIAEQFIQQLNDDLYDYKFLSYGGKVKNLFVVSDRFNKKYFDFYDTDWNKLPFERVFHNSPNGIAKPQNLEKMISLAETLSKDFYFARIDFYDLEDKIYIGEITFYPGNGMEAFQPLEWDYKLGEMLTLPASRAVGGGKMLSLTVFKESRFKKQFYKKAA